MANSFPILIHLFLVAINLEAVLLILPLLMYTLQAYFTSFDTIIVGLLLSLFLLVMFMKAVLELSNEEVYRNDEPGVPKEEFIVIFIIFDMEEFNEILLKR